MNRRKFLTLVGGGVIVAAGTSFAGFALTRTPHKALKPWKLAGSNYDEPRKRALSYAILAPNPHNRQPWKIDLSKPDQIKIFVDTDKLLPHTDPFNRQITIGFGCFLETLKIAAANDGYEAITQVFPQGSDEKALDQRPVAIVQFIKSSAIKSDPLFAQILNRRSNKEPYDLTKQVPDNVIASLKSAGTNDQKINATNDQKQVETLREFTSKALLLEIQTPRTYKESVDLFRIGKAEIEANPDGIDFSGPLFETLALTGQFSREIALDSTTSAYKQAIATVLEGPRTAMAHIWLVSKTNTRVDQIAAGRDWVRVNLTATAHGLATQPLSQVLQEYPEMADYYKKTHEMFAKDGGTVQMLARLGYGKEIPASPRWPVRQKLI